MIDYGENLLEKMSDYLYLTFLDHVDCIGYLMWGPIDLVSATSGEMKKRYGFIYVDKNDYGTGSYQRIKKDSFYWFKEFLKSREYK